ncbi:MAG: hypothetical protein IID30_14090 [Planctomycetes bacterium]|nr:hypothetical protein [Planctomycetota bacterium]
MSIRYINTDLDLECPNDLSSLAKDLEARGVFALHIEQAKEGHWFARFETEEEYIDPETNIAAMLDVIESAEDSIQRLWRECSLREFNIGYDCGDEPWAFNQGLSNATLKRLAEVGATLRFTLYPEDKTTGEEPAKKP